MEADVAMLGRRSGPARRIAIRVAVVGLAAVVAACGGVAPTVVRSPASATPAPISPSATLTGARPDPATVAAAISEAGLRSRLDALAAVSDAASGYRAVGTAGYAAAADLVESVLRDAGWQVSRSLFSMPAFTDPGDSVLTVGDQTFRGRDILPLIYAPPGDASGPVVAIDRPQTIAGPTGKGCDVADYGDLPEGAIVVVRSGPCYRRDQVLAAQQAGASGFVAAYPQTGVGAALRATLIDPAGLEIPAVGASLPAVQALVSAAEAGGGARLTTDATTADAATRSILAELPGSDPQRVVMLGAHLDSVVDGPGINDDGSGVAALLELARAMRGTVPMATIRLAFWSGEELGLKGSSTYVSELSADDRARIVAYLNADMLASPNGFAGVYDESGAPPGSVDIRDRLTQAVLDLGAEPEPVDLRGGSDHQPFDQAGIPTGGLYSGANEVLTADQARSSGGTAGKVADPCYHQPCDDGSSLDLQLGRRLAAALARVAVELAEGSSTPAGPS